MPPLHPSPSYKLPSPPPSTNITTIIMSPQNQWQTFSDNSNSGDDSDDETLSLSDLPINPPQPQENHHNSSETLEEFEFRTYDGLFLKNSAINTMCAAEDIFYRGQLLPLRARSLGNSVNSSSSNCSSTSISRSHSSSSHSSSSFNKFYAHPSPKPQVLRARTGSGRNGTGSSPAGWSVIRLGVVKAPEIELNDLRSRRVKATDGLGKKSGPRFGFGCTCWPDVSEPVAVSPARPLIEGRKKELVEVGVERRSRVFEWLDAHCKN